MIKMSEINTRYGVFLAPNIDTDTIGRFLSEYGEWADLEIQLASELISPNASIADIGAFVGTFGIGLSQRSELTKVCFVEANASIHGPLQVNVKNCCRASAVTLNKALAPVGYAIRSSFLDPMNLGSAMISDQVAHTYLTRIPAPEESISLADLIKEHGPFDLIKMDIEGMEGAILAEKGIFQLLQNTTIMAECLEDYSAIRLFNALKNSGRRVFYYEFPSFNSQNFNGSTRQIFPYAHESGLILEGANAVLISKELRSLGVILEPVADVDDLRKLLWFAPRWCPEDWLGLPIERIIAVASRAFRGYSYDKFLSNEQGINSETLHQQLERTQSALEEAQKIVEQRTKSLSETHEALVDAQQIVFMKTRELNEANILLDKWRKNFQNDPIDLEREEVMLESQEKLNESTRKLELAQEQLLENEEKIESLISALGRSEDARLDAQKLCHKLLRQIDALHDNNQKIMMNNKNLINRVGALESSLLDLEKDCKIAKSVSDHRMMLLAELRFAAEPVDHPRITDGAAKKMDSRRKILFKFRKRV